MADAFVIREGKILLIKRKYNPFKDKWALPGGFIEEGESSFAAAERELYEETNLIGGEWAYLCVLNTKGADPRGERTSTCYLFKPDNPEAAKAMDDAKEFKWVDIEDLTSENMAFDHYKAVEAYKKNKASY